MRQYTPRKLSIFLLVLLIVSCGVHVRIENGSGMVKVRMPVAAAAASGVSSAEESALQQQYDAAKALLDEQEYEKAYRAFEALGEFSDSRAQAAASKKKWKAASYQEALALYNAEQYNEAKAIFESLEGYEKSRSYVDQCTWRAARIEYQEAKKLYDSGDYQQAQKLFESLGKFRDSSERAQDAADMIRAQEQVAAEQESYEKGLALKAEGKLEEARDALIEAGACQGATEQLYSVIHLLALRSVYQQAQSSLDVGRYEDAYDLFSALTNYENSPEKARLAKEAWDESVYQQANALQSTDVNRAYILLLSLDDYKDSAKLAQSLQAKTTAQELYTAADALAVAGDSRQALTGFQTILTYSDSQQRVEQLTEEMKKTQEYKQALFLKSTGETEQANILFKQLGDFCDAADLIEQPIPQISAKHLRDDKTSPKSSAFVAPDGTKHTYQIFKGVRTWKEAKAFCEILGGHLATLTTAEENEFVYRFMRDNGYLTAYFGLSDEKRVGNWVWVTGEPFEYTNWHRGEPSRCGRERYGMYFYKHKDGTWNDSHFYEDAKVDPGCSYICEWDE